jgi:hypothetical protein
MRRPSGVMSSSSWFLKGCSVPLSSMAFFRSSSSCCSLARSSCRASRVSSSPVSGFLSSCVFIASRPPPMLITAVLAPPGPICPGAALTDLPCSMLGFLKYSNMAARVSLSTAATSHMTMKKAIIAVTKSA